MAKLPVSIVIPTMNMSAHLDGLLRSLEQLSPMVDEILVVNDGSTDQTEAIVAKYSFARLMTLKENQGRFKARWMGAKEARSPWLLFLDTRLEPASDFLEALASEVSEAKPSIGWVEIDPKQNVFCLYWLRSHETLFSEHYGIFPEGVELTLENYDRYLKGTGVYLCRREHFLAVCEELGSRQILSDDTLLLKKMLSRERLWINPKLRVHWEPRSNATAFLYRLFERGPGFVEYHIFQHRGRFFYLVLLSLILLSSWIWLLFAQPWLAGEIACAVLLLLGLSARLFAKSWEEFVKMAPLHVAVIFAFGLGVIYGLAYHFLSLARGTSAKPN